MEIEKIKNFTLKFFESLKCNIQEENGIYTVSSVPEKFQKFYGKKGPYKLSFNQESEGVELINKSHFLLKAMNSYLEGRGETTLLKIDFDFDGKKEIEKKFPLRDCVLDKVLKKSENDLFVRFSFLTIFQYQNKKEQFRTNLYVKDGNVINETEFNLDNYETSDGHKRDVKLDNVENDYKLAKKEVHSLLKSKIENISNSLSWNLDKETQRIKSHYENQASEFKNKLEDMRKRLLLFESNLEVSDEQERPALEEKIFKTKKLIGDLEGNEEWKNLKEDEEKAIKDEIGKHTLDIKTKLMNTTIVYYPNFNLSVFIKNKHAKKILDLKYNPMSKEFSQIYCNCCQKELNEIILCSSGHFLCRECGRRCEHCSEILCEKCPKMICEESGKEICKRCGGKCSICMKTIRKTSLAKSKESGRTICRSCAKICSKCGNLFDPDHVKNGICFKCSTKQVAKETIKDIFKE